MNLLECGDIVELNGIISFEYENKIHETGGDEIYDNNKISQLNGFSFFIFVSDDRSIEKTNIAKTRIKNTIKMSIAFSLSMAFSLCAEVNCIKKLMSVDHEATLSSSSSSLWLQTITQPNDVFWCNSHFCFISHFYFISHNFAIFRCVLLYIV